jgi:hypothetical protein
MAEVTGKGSIILKIIILALFIVLFATILYPAKVWKNEDEEKILCRIHLENIYYSVLQYLKEYKTYQSNLDTLLTFMETDSMTVPPGLFEVERLTVWESPRDSFLVGFTDLFHFEKVDWKYLSPDSLEMTLIPKERFKCIPPSKMIFSSEDSIFALKRQKGKHDIYMTVWGNTLIKYNRVEVDSAKVLTKDYSISEEPKDFRVCPTCGQPYDITTNVNLKLQGEVIFDVLTKEEGNVTHDNFISAVFIKHLKENATGEALTAIKADTGLFDRKEQQAQMMVLGKILADTLVIPSADSAKIAQIRDSLLTAMRDSITLAGFKRQINSLKPKSKLPIGQKGSKIVPTDSVSAWNNQQRIKETLFNPDLDKKAQEYLTLEPVQSLIKRLIVSEKYFIAGIDTIGLTISCPIDSLYMPKANFLQRLFGVSPVPNHGQILNGDYSWEEKK